MASENTSRPQPFSTDIGVRKKPSAERGPNDSIAIAQPQTMMTAGVRQFTRGGPASRVAMVGGFQPLKVADAPQPRGERSARQRIARRFGSAKISRVRRPRTKPKLARLMAIFAHSCHPEFGGAICYLRSPAPSKSARHDEHDLPRRLPVALRGRGG